MVESDHEKKKTHPKNARITKTSQKITMTAEQDQLLRHCKFVRHHGKLSATHYLFMQNKSQGIPRLH